MSHTAMPGATVPRHTPPRHTPRTPHPAPRRLRLRLGRHRGLVTAFLVLLALLGLLAAGSARPLGYEDLAQLAASGATLAILSAGLTVVVIAGGLDLSAAAVVSLVNCVLATWSPDGSSSPPALIGLGLATGLACGAFNGILVALLRLQPIVVTLSTMFILQGLTLLVMEKPGGTVSPALSALMTGDLVPGVLPAPVALVVGLLLLWAWLKRTPLGRAIYAVGSDAEAAHAAGLRSRLTVFLTYVVGGACYGLAGVFVSAQTGSGDPLVGNPMLLQMFAAVVVGGTPLGGGRGGCTGSVLGAYILMITVNILLVLNVSASYSTVAESLILLLAVLAASLRRGSALWGALRAGSRHLAARAAGRLPRQVGLEATRLRLPDPPERGGTADPGFLARHGDGLRRALPAYLGFALMVVATQALFGKALFSGSYYDSLLVLSSFLAVLALGQGTVILTGGLDLSVPWTIGLCGIVLAGMVKGSDAALLYAVPGVLGLGAAIGLVNGLGIVLLGLSPIVMSLATNGILQGIALVWSGGTPDGFASPALRAFMTSHVFGPTPVVVVLAVFAAAAVLLLGRTAFGRRVYAIGNNRRAAALSGVAVGPVLLLVYMLSGLCAAIVGILLTGFSGQASLGMGDEYLLPSIAVAVVGGTLITGGRGSYPGMLGGVLLLTALQTLLAGTTVPYAARSILLGLVVLGAVTALRERRP
ncbi:ribose transport system permease protein [Methylobacterium sp. 174MFSha1.1]|uniref:ABC transporter permease n=1 Tax=Methylobacterium sp. 174MFSha1.1 TaxID=1502749 RepID=UPI0008F19AB1|nr:ABC transporter permease [Methylobacterium sp. 174MFSha1.1]SFU75174.1 ribose transport system permease protein [Methylobacterium sp. 174MFSha1.1]